MIASRVVTNVLYFHGFASSPASAKVRSLRALLEPAGIALDTPDLNVPSFGQLSFEGMARLGLERARTVPPRVVVGSSLGAQVALEIARRGIAAPLVLIAPAIGMREQWLRRLPAGDPVRVFNHALGSEAPIHRAFFEEMAAVTADALPPSAPVTVIMGRLDESVSFAPVETTWRRWEGEGLAPGSKFVEIAAGDHGLTAFVDVIAADIIRSAGLGCA
jgi:pimeloyl-ACP methyl ester carboxylesterase